MDKNSEILKVLGVLEGEGRIFMKQKSQAYEVMPCPPPPNTNTRARAYAPPPARTRAHTPKLPCALGLQRIKQIPTIF